MPMRVVLSRELVNNDLRADPCCDGVIRRTLPSRTICRRHEWLVRAEIFHHATINLRLAPGPRDLKARPPRPQKQRTGEQEEVDQLTAFRTGAFESLDSRNGAAP